MLAGYLPFDDDPANPEGDNINLLYKYIVSTALTFPEYVTPHARDLLRRILVPDPRKRADLFEVARHSWLSEYSHVVGFITSNSVTDRDLEKTSAPAEETYEPMLARSASVREPSTRPSTTTSPGGLVRTQKMDGDETADRPSKQRDAKRRTVQVEYVAPPTNTARNDAVTSPVSLGRTRARADSQGPGEVTPALIAATKSQKKADELTGASSMEPPTRPVREPPRSVSDMPSLTSQVPISRPNTQGSMGASSRLPSRGNSYSLPVAAAATNTNAQGRFSQPKPTGGYMISGPMGQDQSAPNSRPISGNFSQFQTEAQPQGQNQSSEQHQNQAPMHKGHKRSSTLGSIGDKLLGRSNSRRSQTSKPQQSEKPDRRHPPVSMKNAMPSNNDDVQGRPSTESRRRPSFNFMRKNSDNPGNEVPSRRSSRRFSWLPSMSSNNILSKKDQPSEITASDPSQVARPRQSDGPGMAFGRGQSRNSSQNTSNSTIPLYYDANKEEQKRQNRNSSYMPNRGPTNQGYDKPLPAQPQQPQQQTAQPPVTRKQYRDDGYGSNALQPTTTNDNNDRFYTPSQSQESQSTSADGGVQHQQQQRAAQPAATTATPTYPKGFNDDDDDANNQNAAYDSPDPSRGTAGLRQQTRKFGDAYETQGVGGHGGSSGGARRVMDWFRNRRQR